MDYKRNAAVSAALPICRQDAGVTLRAGCPRYFAGRMPALRHVQRGGGKE